MNIGSGKRFWKRLLVDFLVLSMLFTSAMPSALNAAGTVYAAEQEIPQENLQEAAEEESTEVSAEEEAIAGDENTAEDPAEGQEDDQAEAQEEGQSEAQEEDQEEGSAEDNAEEAKVATPSEASAGDSEDDEAEEGNWKVVSFTLAGGSLHLDAASADEDSLPDELILELEKVKEEEPEEAEGESEEEPAEGSEEEEAEETAETRTVRIALDLSEGAAAAYDLYMVTVDPETWETVYTELAWGTDEALADVIEAAEEDYLAEQEEAEEGEEEEERPAPEFYLIPDLDSVELTDEQAAWIDDFLAEQNVDSADDWFLKGPGLLLMGTGLTKQGDGTTDIAVNTYSGGGVTSSYSFSGHVLTIKEGGSYRLYDSHQGGNLSTLSVKFATTVTTAVTINLDGISFGAVSSNAAIDFTNVSVATLTYTNSVTVNGKSSQATVNVPTGTTLTVRGTSDTSAMNISTGEDGIAVGTVSGAPGTVVFSSGSVNMTGDREVVLGSLSGTGTLSVTVDGTSTIPAFLTVTGGSSSKFVLKNVSVAVGSNGTFIAYEKSEPGMTETNVSVTGNILQGKLEVNTEQDTSIDLKKGSVIANTLLIPSQYYGFIISLSESGNYTLTGQDGTKVLKYKGIPSGGSVSTTTFTTGTAYTDITSVFSPVFRKSQVDNSSITEGSVTLSAEVDTIYTAWTGGSRTYTGDQNITARGFALYTYSGGEETFLRYEAATNNELPPMATTNTNGGAYSVDVTGLTPGTTYHARPYVTTTAESYVIADKYYGSDGDSGTDATVEFTVPKIDYPTTLEMTYGTTVDAALDRNVFEGEFTGSTVEIAGVTLTFASTVTAPVGSNISGRYDLYSRSGSEGSYTYTNVDTVNLSATDESGETYYVKFAPSSSSALYNLAYKPVTVIVNKKELTVSGVETKTKVYDASTDAASIIGTIGLNGVVSDDDVTATATTAVFNSKDAATGKTIALSGLSISGDEAANYVLSSTTATITGASITKKEITLKPVAMTKQAGETFTPLAMETTDGTSTAGGEAINGGVVPAFDSSYAAYKANPDASYFTNVPGPDANIGVTGDGSWYTVKLKEDKLNQNSTNYQITVKDEQFRFNADKPELDKNYTLPQTSVNGWYKENVVITPKASDLPTGFYQSGYNQVQLRDGATETTSTHPWQSTLTVEETTSTLYFRLKNSSTGAYTYVNQTPVVIKIDKGVPTAEVKSYKKKSDTSVVAGILSNILGNFYNDGVVVNLEFEEENVANGSSGLAVFKYTTNGGATWTEGTLTKTNEGTTMMSATGSFEIPLKQNGNVSFYIEDAAGNRKDYDVKVDGAGSNLWITESTKPVIDSVKVYETGTSTELAAAYTDDFGNKWYSKKVDIQATARDTAGAGEAASGLYSISWKKNTGSYTEKTDGITASPSVYEKTMTLTTLDTDSTPSSDAITITVKAKDNAGNESAENSSVANIKIDATDPVVSDLTQSPVAGTCTNGDVTISFTASDAASGLKSISWAYCTTENGTYGTEHAITVSGNEYSFTPARAENLNGWYRVTVTDHVDRVTVKKIHVENIDRIKPAISAFAVTAPATADAWYHENVTLTVTAADVAKTGVQTDATSGLVSYTYTVTKDSVAQDPVTETWTAAAASMTISLTETGEYSVSVKVKDAAGNESDVSTESGIKIDLNTPSIKVTATNAASGDDVWTNSNVTFKLENTATAQPSGVTYYVKEGATETEVGAYAAAHSSTASWSAVTSTLTFSDDTKANLKFVLKAANGLSSTSSEYKVRLTKTAPETPGFTSVPVHKTGWFNASDAPVVTATASPQRTDKAGVTTKLTWKEADGTLQNVDITTGTKVFDFTATPAAGSVDLSDGTWTFTYLAEDKAGNKSDAVANEIIYKVDTAAPVTGTVTYSYEGMTPGEEFINKLSFGLFFNKKIVVTIPISDATSGVSYLKYNLNSGETGEPEYTSIATLNAEKTQATFEIPLGTKGYISYVAADEAGNTTGRKNLMIDDQNRIWAVEADAPVIANFTKTGTAKVIEGVTWFKGQVDISAQVTDEKTTDSGLNWVKWILKNGETEVDSYTENFGGGTAATTAYEVTNSLTTDVDGYSFIVKTMDNAGNTAEKSEIFHVDVTDPTVSEASRKFADDTTVTGDTNQDIYITWKVTDKASGVGKVTVGGTTVIEDGAVKADLSDDYTVKTIEDGFEIKKKVTGNGDIVVYAEDRVENSKSLTSAVNCIDKLAPEYTQFQAKTAPVGQFYTDPAVLQITANDAAPTATSKRVGIKSIAIEYSLDGASGWTQETGENTSISYTTPVESAAVELVANVDGTHYFRAVITDAVGNHTETSAVQLKIDIGNPDIQVYVSDTKDGDWATGKTSGSWLNGDGSNTVFEVLSTADPVSGTDLVDWYVTKDSGAEVKMPQASYTWVESSKTVGTVTYKTYKLTVNDEGVHTYQFRVAKKSTGLYQTSVTYTVNIDRTSPAASSYSVINGTEGEDSWYKKGTQTPQFKFEQAEPDIGDTTGTAPRKTWYKLWQGDSEPTDGTQIPEGGVVAIPSPTNGIWNIKTWTTDEAGNSSSVITGSEKVDLVTPTIGSFTIKDEEAKLTDKILSFLKFGNYSKTVLEITVPVTDEVSKPVELSYTISNVNGSPVTDDASTTDSADASTRNYKFTIPELTTEATITLTAVDGAGNESTGTITKTSGNWTIETGKPVITVSDPVGSSVTDETTTPATIWYNGTGDAVKVSYTVTDSTSGLRSVEYGKKIGEGTEAKTTEFAVTSADNAKTTEKKADKIMSKTGADDGLVKVTIYATDNAGNEESASREFHLDTEAPTIGEPSGNPTTWVDEEQKISFTWFDATSGIDQTSLVIEKDGTDVTSSESVDVKKTDAGFSFMTVGNGDYKATVKDKAGNESSKSVTVDHIDTTDPEEAAIAVTTADGTVTTKTYVTKNPTVKVTVPAKTTVSDTVTTITIYREGTQVDQQTVTNEAKVVDLSAKIGSTIDADGFWKITAVAENQAGTKTSSEFEFTLDRFAPVVPAEYSFKKRNTEESAVLNKLTFGVFFKDQVEICFTPRDEGEAGGKKNTGVNELYYKLTDEKGTYVESDLTATAKANNYKVLLPLEEKQYLYYYIVDTAGNKTAVTEFTHENVELLLEDNVKPTVTEIAVTGSEGSDTAVNPNTDGWYNTSVWLKATVKDDPSNTGSNASGLNKVTWTENGTATDLVKDPTGITTSYSVNREVSTQGERTVSLSASDNALNEADSKSKTVKIDKTAPKVTLTTDPEELTKSSNQDKTVEMRVADETSKAVTNGKDSESQDYEYIIVRRIKNAAGETVNDTVTLIITADGTEGTSDTGKKFAPAYNLSFKATENGTYTVKAKDLAGNETDYGTVVVAGIDKTDIVEPTLTINGAAPSDTWYAKRGGELVFLITNQEHGKGTKVYWAFGTGAEESGKPAEAAYTDIADGADGKGTVNPSVEKDGIHYLWIKTERNTGAAAVCRCYTVRVDTTKATIDTVTVTNKDGKDGKTNWTNQDQTVGFHVTNTVEEGASGKSDIDSVTVKLGAEAVTVTAGTAAGDMTPYTFTATVNGTYTATAVDKAGNTQTLDIVIDHIDKTKPATPVSEILNKTAGAPATDWTKTMPSIKITKVEPAADVAPVTTKYSFVREDTATKIEGTVDTATKTVAFTADGVWTWTIWSEDEAGNKSDEDTGTLKIDTIAPVMTGATVTRTNDSALAAFGRMLTFGNYFKEAIKVTVDVTDAQTAITTSGNYKLQYIIGSGEEQSADITDGKATFTIPLETSASQVKMTVTDRCGNKSGAKYLVKNTAKNNAALGDAAELWVVDNTKPVIDGTSFTITSDATLKNGFYNKDVTFGVSVTDAESGINKVTWTYQTNGGAETDGTTKSYGELAAVTNTVSDVKQTIGTEGVTVIDFKAENNATVTAALSELKEAGARTIKIDKTEPVIAYVSGNPDAWTADEQTISFTVTDTAAAGAAEHAGVDDDTVKVKRLANGSLPEKEITVTVLSGSSDAHSYSFVTEGNAVYEITGSDLAGNAAEKLSVTVQYIDATVPAAPEKNDTASADGSACYTKQTYYTSVPEITVKSSVNYVINSAEANTAPVTTCYQMYREGDADPATYEVKSTEPGTGSVPTADTEDAGLRIDADTARDGKWILKVWNKTASGKVSGEIEESFFIDRVAPTIVANPEEIKADDQDVKELLNKLSFGIFFNKTLTATVRVNDVSSYGETLTYTNSATDEVKDVAITLDTLDPTTGTAEVVLPVIAEGTAFTVTMKATDKAGNTTAGGNEVKLAVKVEGSDVDVWVLENTVPTADPDATQLLDADKQNPQTSEEEIDFNTAAYIRMKFSEYVKPAADGRVRISVGSDFYYADLNTADITTGAEGTEPTGITEPASDTYKKNWYVTIPLSEFKKDGKSLKLAPSTSYVVTVLAGAFEDIARNLNKSTLVCAFTTKDGTDIPKPVIKGGFTLNIDPTEGKLSPEFDKDVFAYTLLLFDTMLDSTGSFLKKDLSLSMNLETNVDLGKVQLKDIEGNVLWTLTEEEITRTGSNVSFGVPGSKIKKKENYYLSLAVESYNKTSTYSFFISTSAISIKSETTSGRSKVEVAKIDLEDLAQKLYTKLVNDALENWKVSVNFKAQAVSAESVPTETAAAIALAKNKTEAKSYDSLAAYPVEISIEELLGRTGETVYIEDLGGEKVLVTFAVPVTARGKLVGIYREHNGITEELGFTLNQAGTEATVETGKFSVYSLVYGVNNGGTGGGGGTGSGTLSMGGFNAIYGGTWHNDGKLFVKEDGTKPADQFIRVDGKIYYIDKNGFASQPANYTIRNDYSVIGTVNETVTDMKGTWVNDGWRYTKMDGSDLKNGWAYLAYNGKFDWYYFNTSGWMLDGWFNDGKNDYYLHTVHDRTRGHMYTGWHFINGKWYYFRTKPEGVEGSLLRSGYAADGHYVLADGTWDGKGAVPVAGN